MCVRDRRNLIHACRVSLAVSGSDSCAFFTINFLKRSILVTAPAPYLRKVQRDKSSEQQLLASGDRRSRLDRSSCILFRFAQTASASAPNSSSVKSFQFLARSLARYASLSWTKSRNQLSANEAACRSSRTLEGIRQALHARVSAPSNLRVADGDLSNVRFRYCEDRSSVARFAKEATSAWKCNASRRATIRAARAFTRHPLMIADQSFL